MLLFGRLPVASLIELCRVLRHSLSAGIMLRTVFEKQAKKGSAPLRPIAERIAEGLAQGDTLEVCLDRDKKAFPPMFLALATVGEQTGNMPEIFAALEKYYIVQQRFWRQFWAQATYPILQYFAAIFVIAGAMWIMGVIAEMNRMTAADPLGVGLRGGSGAIKFLLMNFGFIAALVVGYLVLSRSLRQKAIVDRALLGMPVVGPFLMAFNLSRLATALHLTLDSGMSIAKGVGLSLKATGNAAFAATAPGIQESIRAGEDLLTAFTKARVFPEDFLHMLSVGEAGGRVPEVMRQQAEQYAEEAERRLAVVSKMMGFGVWLAVAAFIIFLIFRMATMYLNVLNSFTG
jgi:type IV pilus assembly protein PilC